MFVTMLRCDTPEMLDGNTNCADVSVQKQILALLRKMAVERGVGIILITHDIGVIAEITDNVTVLRGGRLKEEGPTAEVLGNPQHEYTKALMAAVPRLEARLDRFTNIVKEDTTNALSSDWIIPGASADFATEWLLKSTREVSQSVDPIMTIKNLDVTFYSDRPFAFAKRKEFKALKDISLDVVKSETLGVIGESGSGKSTLAKSIVGLVNPSAGEIRFEGDMLPQGRKRSRKHSTRRKVQMVFQDPYSSLNNRRKVYGIIAEPIRFFGLADSKEETRKIVASVLELVEMPHRAMLQYPHQFSGGQRQRIAVARALVAKPEFLICDEPTSALDVSIQAQILNLLIDLQQTFGMTILFISHNLAVVRQMSDRIVVLKNGVLVEKGTAEDFFNAPQDSYSRKLLRERCRHWHCLTIQETSLSIF